MAQECPLSEKTLLFIDTGFNNPYCYDSLFTLARSAGFNPLFKPFYNVSKQDLVASDTIFFNIDGLFLKNYLEARLQKKEVTHPVLVRILALIATIAQSSHKTITLLLPELNIKQEAFNILLLEDLTRLFNIIPQEQEARIKPAMSIFFHELLQPDHIKSTSYNTALLHTRESKEIQSTNLEIKDPNDDQIIVKTVPLFQCDGLKTYPLALYTKNNAMDNQFFISKISLLTFADIKESFVYNPMDYPLRTLLLTQLQQFLCVVYQSHLHKKLLDPCQQNLVLPSLFNQQREMQLKGTFANERNKNTDQKKYAWVNKEEIWCGWGGLEQYEKKEPQAVEHLGQSGINLLWLELNPEWYLAENAMRKDQKNKFLSSIEAFTKAYAAYKEKEGLSLPHFFVGTDITSNFRVTPVKHPVRDVYGTVYSKIPCPFDVENFWQPELFDVLTSFKKEWRTINHGVTLDGIFLDLEMYHAQDQSGQYTTEMDFSDYAWNLYVQAKQNPSLMKLTFENRIRYLLDQQQFDDYFAFLHHEAFKIGRLIKNYCHQEFPHALLGAYNIHLPHAWFYLGLLAGLSSPQDPLILATFNNEFYRHYSWLHQQNIFLYHMPVLLLSKFKKIEDFGLINEFEKTHDGAWFNRISRLEESRDPQTWQWDYGVETSPLSTEIVVNHMKHAITECQKNLK